MGLMAYGTIILERKGPVAIIRINRPDKLNAMNAQVKEEIAHALAELEKDDGTHVVVLTGVGDKAFVAGADINEFAGKKPIDTWNAYGHTSLYNVVDRFPKPIIAMINGYCLGGGCELAMACDIRVASDKAQLGQPEINIGIIPGGGGSQRLPRLVGLGKALELILTGDRIPATEALEIGLVDTVVPHEELEKQTMALAEKIASKSPVAVRLAKAAVKASVNMPLDQGLRHEQSLFSAVFSTEDKEEGVRAFQEKRPPQWKGR